MTQHLIARVEDRLADQGLKKMILIFQVMHGGLRDRKCWPFSLNILPRLQVTLTKTK